MGEHGCSKLLADESGRVLDRLAGWEGVISPDVVREVLMATGRVNERDCRLTHEVMMWVVVGMGVLTDMPLRMVFKNSRRMREGEILPLRSTLCEARQRLGVEPLRELHRRVVRPLATLETPGAFYQGLRLMGIDGSVFDVPDSAANAVFGRSSGGRSAGAFPQVRKLSWIEWGTHVEVAFQVGGWHESEQSLAPQLWEHLPADSLLLEDRGFFSYGHWKALHERVKLLVRVKKTLVLTAAERLADGSYLAQIYPSSDDRKQDRQGIVVRVIEYTLNDPGRTGHGEVHRLLTNLLDVDQFPAHELIVLYHERWEAELVFDEQKTHQDPRRAEKPAHLRSESPDGVRQELYALSLGHFVVRSLLVEAAQPTARDTEHLDVDRLSFTAGLHTLPTRLPECTGLSATSLSNWSRDLLFEIRQDRVPPAAIASTPESSNAKCPNGPKNTPTTANPNHRDNSLQRQSL